MRKMLLVLMVLAAGSANAQVFLPAIEIDGTNVTQTDRPLAANILFKRAALPAFKDIKIAGQHPEHQQLRPGSVNYIQWLNVLNSDTQKPEPEQMAVVCEMKREELPAPVKRFLPLSIGESRIATTPDLNDPLSFKFVVFSCAGQ